MGLLELLLIIFVGAAIVYATYFYWAVIIARKPKFPFENASLKSIFSKALWKQ
jgi:hypothetical protein